jgi:hypothetical protein
VFIDKILDEFSEYSQVINTDEELLTGVLRKDETGYFVTPRTKEWLARFLVGAIRGGDCCTKLR